MASTWNGVGHIPSTKSRHPWNRHADAGINYNGEKTGETHVANIDVILTLEVLTYTQTLQTVTASAHEQLTDPSFTTDDPRFGQCCMLTKPSDIYDSEADKVTCESGESPPSPESVTISQLSRSYLTSFGLDGLEDGD